MAEELYVPAVAPPPVRQIKYFQLFSVVMAVHPASVPAWQLRGAFAFLGFACGGPEAISRADGSCAAFSSDVVYISGGQVKNLVLRGDSGEVLSVVRPVSGFGASWICYGDDSCDISKALEFHGEEDGGLVCIPVVWSRRCSRRWKLLAWSVR
ncbi:uncharacterized protein LOC120648830 [Panicum virgatum]|uniref:uncharacterized protein LOC120648830 n=1 Tax=Panicum virgatum TaxID=38727 RepID=UPI0019D5B5E4|nr:uncharacterized protein LOC120648830 [Panicum virgatum]